MVNQPAPGNRGHFISAIPDALWEAFTRTSAAQGESAAAVARRLFAEYVRKHREYDQQ